MRNLLLFLSMLAASNAFSQSVEPLSIFDGRNWGVVLNHPDMQKVVVKQDVPYLNDSKGTLKMDVYLPPDMKPNEKRPAVIFLNAIGDQPGQMKIKSWGTYKSWPRLMAANGIVGISMENDGERIEDGFKALFSFLANKGIEYQIDATRLGVYAASANVTNSMTYLMKPDAFTGIRAAVLYYGGYPSGPYRKDLPVMFVVSEGDIRGDRYSSLWSEVMKNRAPWTVVMGSGLIHAFDSFTDSDDSRKMIKETISFWKNHLEPIPPHSWPNSIGREVLAAQYGHDLPKTAELLKKYLESNPDDKDALAQYGSTLVNQKEYAAAEASLKKAMALDPSNVSSQSNLIVVYYALNRNDEAKKLLATAEKTGKMTRNNYANIGISLYTMGKHKEGVPFYEKIVAMKPYNVDYYNLACGYAILNEKDKAFVMLDKAVAAGYQSKEQYENDSDLNSLRSDKRYAELVLKLK